VEEPPVVQGARSQFSDVVVEFLGPRHIEDDQRLVDEVDRRWEVALLEGDSSLVEQLVGRLELPSVPSIGIGHDESELLGGQGFGTETALSSHSGSSPTPNVSRSVKLSETAVWSDPSSRIRTT